MNFKWDFDFKNSEKIEVEVYVNGQWIIKDYWI